MKTFSENIKYDFNQIETGIIAFVSNVELKLRNILPELPVFVLETGDTTYYLKEKFIETTNEEVYQKVPRFIINVDDVQPQFDQNTNQYNKIIYKYEEQNYIADFRRLSILLPIETSFVSPNFIMALRNFEILSTMMVRENPFTYEFLGNTYSGAFNFQAPSMQKPGMEVSGTAKNSIIKSQIELWLNIAIPRIETIKLLSDTGFESIQYDMNIIGQDENDSATLIQNFEEP